MRPLAFLAAATLAAAPATLRAQAAAPTDTAVVGKGACTGAPQAAAARELLVLSNTERQMTQSADAMVESQLRASPFMAQHFGDLLRDFVKEQMQWRYFEPQFTRLYCQLYTESELRQLVAFQKTPIGRKLVETTPELTRRAMEMSETRVQAAMPELQKRVEERMAQLKAEGKLP